MMKTETFNPVVHLREIRDWSRGYGIGDFPDGVLPPTGRVVPGLAALFLYKTDSEVGFIENMISNPEAPRDQVGAALDACFRDLQEVALRSGITLLTGSSCIPAVIDRTRRWGFKVSPANFRLTSKRLG